MGQRASALTAAAVERQSISWWTWTLSIFTLAGGALRFAALGQKTFWLDEAFSLWMARHDIPLLFHWLVYIDQHPPLFYLLLHLWIGWFGDRPAALRSLSALTSTLAIPFFALAARKLTGRWVAVVATLLLVISPFQLRYAQEVRMYGVLMLAVAILLFALSYLLAENSDPTRGRRWTWLLLVVAEAAAMLTHNTATVLVPIALNGAMAGVWLAQRRGWVKEELSGVCEPKFWRNWIWSQVATLLLWSPWAFAYIHQALGVERTFWIEPPTLWTVWLFLGTLSYAFLPDWLPKHDYLAWLTLGLVVWGLWQWRRSFLVSWLLLVLWLVPPAVELLVSLQRPIFYDRTIIWTMMPYLILVARGMVLPNTFKLAWRGAWLLATVALVGTLCGLGLWNYRTTVENENWDQVAAFVAKEAQPQQLVLFHASWTELPFNYYYVGDVPALVHHGVPADLFDAGQLEPPMTEADKTHVRELVKGRDRVWLVYSHWWYTDPEGLLLQVLDEEMDAVQERDWPGIRVIEYVRK